MTSIQRHTDMANGTPDGVLAEINCGLTMFAKNKTPKTPKVVPCTVLCAYSEGTASFLLRDRNLMLTIRLDELVAILHEASNAALEFQKAHAVTE